MIDHEIIKLKIEKKSLEWDMMMIAISSATLTLSIAAFGFDFKVLAMFFAGAVSGVVIFYIICTKKVRGLIVDSAYLSTILDKVNRLKNEEESEDE